MIKESNNLIMPHILNLANELIRTKVNRKIDNYGFHNIIDSQKFKLLTNIGKIYENISNILSVDYYKFNGYQTTIEKINENIETNQNDIENNINNIISINVFIRESDADFENYEYSKKEIDTKFLKAIKIAFLEYDEKYEILKKYSIAEIKDKACSLFTVKKGDYMILSKNFDWIQFNLNVYQEIFMINLAKKYINSSYRFFQFNAYISVKFNCINKLGNFQYCFNQKKFI
jgi:hypothetical protein